MLGLSNRKVIKSPAARRAALNGTPHQVPPVKSEEKDGKLYVTVRFRRPSWQKFLGAAEDTCQRTFGLDAYGRGVYESCDGKKTVKAIVEKFAKGNNVSLPEAEMAVTSFIRTLMMKGLIAMEMEK